jgi:UDP-glucose 4-epimerase
VNVFVTGGAGFIGANLSALLATTDGIDRVLVLDDLSTGYPSNLEGVGDHVEFHEGSILDPDTVDSLVCTVEAVIHLAARPSVPKSLQDPVASHNVNVNGTLNILEACRRQATPPKVIFASSSSVYGSNPELPKHERLACMPMSPYAASKLAAESYVLAYQASFGVPALAVRFFNVYGPLQPPGHAYAAVVPAFVDAALQHRAVPLHGDGTQSRDFTYVRTVAEVLTAAVVRDVTSPGPVNLAFGTRTNLNELISDIGALLGEEISVEHLPNRLGDVPHSQADNSLLRTLFPDITPVDLDRGLRDTIEWMKSRDV